MSETESEAAQSAVLSGPASLAFSATSILGPFATARSRTAIRPMRFSVANVGPAELTLTPPHVDRLRRSEEGARAEGSIRAAVVSPAHLFLPSWPGLSRPSVTAAVQD